MMAQLTLAQLKIPASLQHEDWVTPKPSKVTGSLSLSLSPFLEGFYNLVSPRHSKNPVFGANLREPGLKASC